MSRTADRIRQAAAVRPSPRQLAWQALEFYGFIHFGINTMTDREWGLGHEDPALFHPTALDAGQWVASLKSAGMRGLILTCKHHDGFCLWPTATTSHSVAASQWRGGKGDVVAEVARACTAEGLQFGVYLSPWDRNASCYGSDDYDDFFVAQLRELLTGYGPVFAVWFDGANGEGPSGRRQLYDWARYFALVRELQPEAVISVCGPDVRWCGNEAGHTRANEWSVVPAGLRDAERTASHSQKVDDGQFARLVRSDTEDLGSRSAILASDEPLVWYPAEVNTSIRPGWFYHATEDGAVRSAAELFDIYCGSVGGNATFLLNVPPNAEGLVADADRTVLAELGDMIRDFMAGDIADRAAVEVAGGRFTPDTGYALLPTEASGALTLTFPAPMAIEAVVLEEDIAQGQQIDALRIDLPGSDGMWETIATVGSIGYRRIVRFRAREAAAVRLVVATTRGPCALRRPRVISAR